MERKIVVVGAAYNEAQLNDKKIIWMNNQVYLCMPIINIEKVGRL